jgi:hypothetical protein
MPPRRLHSFTAIPWPLHRYAGSHACLANSPSVGPVDFTNNGAWRMATSDQHGPLDRLPQIAVVLGATSMDSSTGRGDGWERGSPHWL